MPPTRKGVTSQSTASTSSSVQLKSSAHGDAKSKRKHGHQQKDDASSPLALPGVQKIKAQLRQTRRLLAKDKLAADVRTKTERRLKSLEADLAQAERVRKERAMSARYHGVKFFERQKITRRIQQVKRQLSQSEASDKGKEAAKLGKKERKQLEKKLEELRVDLNYIIHYPKLKKYISLFPPELRSQSQEHSDPYPHSYSRPSGSENETDAQREEVRAWVREQMAASEMSAEPELEIRSANKDGVRLPKHISDRYPAAGHQGGKQDKMDVEIGVQRDEFFGDDDDNSDGERIEGNGLDGNGSGSDIA